MAMLAEAPTGKDLIQTGGYWWISAYAVAQVGIYALNKGNYLGR